MIKVKRILIFMLILNTILLNGQNAVFSQFYNNPLSTNPALTGVFKGSNRIGTTIRNQWYSIVPNASLVTSTIFFDHKSKILNGDYLGIGAMVADDRSGLAKIEQTQGYLSLSYSKHLYAEKYRGINQYLVFGAQFGYGISYLHYSGFLFGSQFNRNTELVDPGIDSGENLLDSKLYPDINMGLMWYYTDSENSYYLSGSISHLNRPDISLVQGIDDKMKMKYSGLLGAKFLLEKGLILSPALFFNMQGNIIQSIAGTKIRFTYSNYDDTAFEVGLWARVTNSISGFELPDIIFSSSYQINHLEFGLSYDITISNLNHLNGYKGAFELSMVYIFGGE